MTSEGVFFDQRIVTIYTNETRKQNHRSQSTLQSSDPGSPIPLFNSTLGELSKTEFASKEAEMVGFVSVAKQGSSVFPCFCELAMLWQIPWSFASTEEWRGL